MVRTSKLPENQPSDRRTRHRLERLDRVFESAIELFIEKGFDDTTMDEIAERADVARASTFNYFDRKSALLDEWLARQRTRVAGLLADEHRDADPIELTLSRWAAIVSAEIEANPAESVALMSACMNHLNLVRDHSTGKLLADYIAAARRSGSVRKSVDPDSAATLIALGYFNVYDSWIRDQSLDVYKELMKVLDLVFDGVLASEQGPRTRRVRAPRRKSPAGKA